MSKQTCKAKKQYSEHSTSILKERQEEEVYIEAQRALSYLEEFSNNNKPVCRDKEMQQIRKFVTDGIDIGGCSQTLYIAGIPGIGKTLTVTSVIEDLKENDQYKRKFKPFYLNAMAYKHPKKIYKSLLSRVFKQSNISQQKQIPRLNYLFTTSSQTKVKVIIIDQLDYLVTKDQSVLYNLFQWAQNPNSKLILITISNTLNLPEKLNQKIYSRMGDAKIAFSTYDKNEMQKIIEQRLKDTVSIFSSDALNYACTKAVAVSCDIRKTLFLLRSSLNILISSFDSQQVQIHHIREAFQTIFTVSPECQYIRLLPKLNQLILIYIALDQSNSKSHKCLTSSLCSRIHAAYKHISSKCIQRILLDLKQVGILSLQKEKVNHTMDQIIKLEISTDQIKKSIESEQYVYLIELID